MWLSRCVVHAALLAQLQAAMEGLLMLPGLCLRKQAAALLSPCSAQQVFELEPQMASAAMWREADLMRQCVHRRIVPLLGVAIDSQLFMLVMELMPGGSLQATLQSPNAPEELHWNARWARGCTRTQCGLDVLMWQCRAGMPWPHSYLRSHARCRGRGIALDVSEALDYLHSRQGVLHGDLKPSNVLLSAGGRASIADLGVSQALGSGARSHLGCTSVYGGEQRGCAWERAPHGACTAAPRLAAPSLDLHAASSPLLFLLQRLSS